jgi:hypothetical protein
VVKFTKPESRMEFAEAGRCSLRNVVFLFFK